ncbi:MAG: EamA family transporter, partial [Rothia dentocariosa]|nr:EamA family transporter [Rothia dentocariosa]
MTPGTTRHKRPTVGIIFVIISCLSLQFGAAFAVHLFPLFGPWLVTVLRLLLAAITVGAAVWFAGRWRAHRAGAQTVYMAVPAKTSDGFLGWSSRQWRAMLIFGVTLGLMNGFFYNALARIPLGLAVAIEFTGPLVLASILTRRKRDLVWVFCAAAGMAVLGFE